MVLGIILSGCGLDSALSIQERWSQLSSGWNVDGPMMFGGVLSLIVGLALYRHSAKAAPKKK